MLEEKLKKKQVKRQQMEGERNEMEDKQNIGNEREVFMKGNREKGDLEKLGKETNK